MNPITFLDSDAKLAVKRRGIYIQHLDFIKTSNYFLNDLWSNMERNRLDKGKYNDSKLLNNFTPVLVSREFFNARLQDWTPVLVNIF